MYSYSIMPLDTRHVDEICEDIRQQYESGVCDLALFCMTLVPEGTPVIDKAGILCEKYDLFAEKLGKMGLKAGILVQASIGHGWALDEMFPFTTYANLADDGGEATCCPYDEDFREHFKGVMRTLALRHPAMIMVDDDLRLMLRTGKGCYCHLHRRAFEKLYGKPMSREELYAHTQGDSPEDKRITSLFIETQEDSLIGCARAMREGIDSVDPTIQGAYCSTGESCEAADELAKILAGKGNPSIVRFNNGSYSPDGAHQFSAIMQRAASQAVFLRDKVDVLLAETDTCPQNRYSTGAQFVHAHYTASILEGASGAKHWITRLNAYEPASGVAYRKLLAAHHGFYDELIKLMPSFTPFGCRIPLPRKRPYYFKREVIWERGNNEEVGWSACVLERLGLPLYFSEKNGGAVFMSEEADTKFSDDEIREMLAGTVFLGGNTAAHLIERGFGDYLGVDVLPWEGVHLTGELIDATGEVTSSPVDAHQLVPKNDRVRSESTLFHLENGKNRIPCTPGCTVFENALGGTAIVFSGTPKTTFHFSTAFSFLSESRKKQLIKLLSQTGNLPVYYPGDAEMMLRAGNLSDGRVLCALFDLSFDRLDSLELVTAFPVKAITRLMPDGSYEAVPFTADGNTLTLSTEVLPLDPAILLLEK